MVSAVDWRAVTSGGVDITGQRHDQSDEICAAGGDDRPQQSGWRTAFLVRLQLRGLDLTGAQVSRWKSRVPIRSGLTDRTPRKLTTSGLHPDPRPGQVLADFTLTGTSNRPCTTASPDCLGGPPLRLGHQVAISLDAGVIAKHSLCHVYEIRWRRSRQGFSQDVELVDRERLYAYATASPVCHFRLGATALGTAGRYFN